MSGKGCNLRLWHYLDFSLIIFYSTDRSRAVVPVLLFVTLWFILRGDLFYVTLCFVLAFAPPFSIVITSRWEERANLSASHTFVRFALI